MLERRFMWKLPPSTMRMWSMSAQRVVGSFGIFDVTRAKVHDGEGNPRRDVHTFRCSDWCNIVAITPDDHLVLVRQFRFGTERHSLELPGGMIDEGEQPIQAAARELAEESGYFAEKLKPLSVLSPNPALAGNRIFSFVARNVTPTASRDFDDLEELETVLVPVSELPAMLDAGAIEHALCAVAIEQFLRCERQRAAF